MTADAKNQKVPKRCWKLTASVAGFARSHASILGLAVLLAVFSWPSAIWAQTIQPTQLSNRLFPADSTSSRAAGSSVAMHGDFMMAGDPMAGAVYVFKRVMGEYTQVQTLTGDVAAESGFGTAIACDGTTLAVGSPIQSKVYLFRRDGEMWNRTDRIHFSTKNTFGQAVAVKGDLLLVGAPRDSNYWRGSGDDTGVDSGNAYLFHRTAPNPNEYGRRGGDNEWGPLLDSFANEGHLPIHGVPRETRGEGLYGAGTVVVAGYGDRFGEAVALSDSVIAIGSPGGAPGRNPGLGCVYLYEIVQSGGIPQWKVVHGIVVPRLWRETHGGSRFGAALAAQGRKLLVGAPNYGAGAAYMFETVPEIPYPENRWREASPKSLFPADGIVGNRFGSAVLLDGNNIVVTAPNHALPIPFAPTATGAVYRFTSSGSFQEKLMYGGCETDTRFAVSVAIANGVIAVGATNVPPNMARGSVWLSEGVSDDLKVRWAAPGGGGWSDSANWSPAQVPQPCDVVQLDAADPVLRTINMTRSWSGLGDPPPPYEIAKLNVDSGRWYLDVNSLTPARSEKGRLHVSRSIDVGYGQASLDGQVALVNAAVSTPEVLIGTGGKLSLLESDLTADRVLLFRQSTLLVDGGETQGDPIGGSLKVANLTIASECRLGWRNASIEVENDLIFNDSHVLNIEINPSDSGSEVPLFKVPPGRQFKAGGRLNFIHTGQDPLEAGQRFRLVEFTATTKIAEEIYKLYRFKNYDPTIPGRDDLIWGLAFRQEGGVLPEKEEERPQFIELLVLEKPKYSGTTSHLSPVLGKSGLVFATHGSFSSITGVDQGGFAAIAAGIKTFLDGKSASRWDVVTFDWRDMATQFLDPDNAANPATSAQVSLGIAESLHHWMTNAGFHYEDMHLLSHSSGSWMVNRLRQLNRNAAVQLTMFDAFTSPGKPFSKKLPYSGRFQSILGAAQGPDDFAEHYVDKSLGAVGTEDRLPNAMNFDVTDAVIPSHPYSNNVGIPIQAQHAWPYVWYLETIKFANGNPLALPAAYCGGFLISSEFLETSTGYEYMQDYKETLRNGMEIRIGPNGCENMPIPTILEPYTGKFQDVAFAPVGTYSSTLDGGVSMTTGSATAAGPVPAGEDGPVPQGDPPPMGSQWAAVTNYVLLPHAAVEFSFDYQFSGSSTGLLSVYVNQIFSGVIDQSVAGTNLLTSGQLPLSPILGAGPHKILFFLESSSAEPASVALSNLQFGYDPRSIIVSQQVLQPGVVRLSLQGIPNRNYTMERATNVTGLWTNIGIAALGTNGLGNFTDSNAPATRVFYRAVAAEPIVVSPTLNLTNLVGENITLAPVVHGTPVLGFQWVKDGTAIQGATNATLTLLDLMPDDSGSYSLTVSNTHGVVESEVANLVVPVPPTITAQPLGWGKLAGGEVQMTVSATAPSPLSYQWRKNGTALSDGGRLTGATTSTLAVSNLVSADAGEFDVVITTAEGASATS